MPLLDQFKKQFNKWVAPEDEEELEPVEEEQPQKSPGFESIYALENIDLKTVRPMGSATPEVALPIPMKREVAQVEHEPQVVDEALDLGVEYRGWIRSFRLDEPVRALGLSPMAEKTLREKGKHTLADLIDEKSGQMLPLEGMGQGHIDEVRLKVQERMSGSSTTRSARVDYCALIRGVCVQIPPKECSLLLKRYDLSELCSLSMAQAAELRHLGGEKEQEMVQHALNLLQSSENKGRILDAFRQVIDVFLKPWIRGRGGLAKERELIDRLEEIGLGKARAALRFLADHFFDGKLPLSERLLELDPGVYAADYSGKQQYQKVLNLVHSYFYSCDLHYTLADLMGLVGRELARRWDGVPEAFAIKALQLSPDFRVRRDRSGELCVRMAWWLR